MPDNDRNIDPGMMTFYKALNAKTPAGSEHWPLAEQRHAWNALCREFRAERPAGIDVEDIVANAVPCRLFRPQSSTALPIVIYGHGGGWVLGGPDTHDDMCAELSAKANCAVLLMDYRLAPEHPHPAQLEDSLKVWRWVNEQASHWGFDPKRIIAAGDSAGGQLSVALALALRDLALPQVAGLLLIYPVLGANMETASYLSNAHAPCLTRDEMKFYLEAFLGPHGSAAWSDEKAVPNLLRDVMRVFRARNIILYRVQQ